MRVLSFGFSVLLLAASANVFAQSAAAVAAQTQYQQSLAACDPAQPRPAYNACVRAAGTVLDRSGATGGGTVMEESSDGRASIVQVPGQGSFQPSPSAVVPETFTSQDGRATLLVPSDSTILNGGTGR